MINTGVNRFTSLHVFIILQSIAFFCGAIAEFRIVFVFAEILSFGVLILLYRKDELDKKTVIITALVLRILFIAWLPGLSDDAFRYLWDGLVQEIGFSPFQFLPVDKELSVLHLNPVYDGLNSKKYFAVYPPISQFLFLASTWVDFGIQFFSWIPSYFVIKLSRALAEIFAMIIVVNLLSAKRSMLYALNPLIIIECAGQAHAESSMLLGLALIIWGVRKSFPFIAVLGLTIAVWTKIYPILFLPILLKKIGYRYVVPFALMSIAIAFPYFDLTAIQNIQSSVDLYVSKFEFNAGIYYSLKKIVNWWTGRIGWGPTIGPILRLVFGVGATIVLIQNFRGRQSWLVSAMWIATIYLITATTIHPWYLSSLILFLPFLEPIRWEWLFLAALSVGTYLRYTHDIYWIFVVLAWIAWVLVWMLRSHKRPVEVD